MQDPAGGKRRQARTQALHEGQCQAPHWAEEAEQADGQAGQRLDPQWALSGDLSAGKPQQVHSGSQPWCAMGRAREC